MYKKILIAIGVTILFLGTCINPSIAIDNIKNQSIPISSGNTLYVGGTGEGNYTFIQDAIDNATMGDTVYVYRGLYYEKVKINKTITFMGESRDNTIIDASDFDSPLDLEANNISVSGFTFQNSGNRKDKDGGIRIRNWGPDPFKSNNNTIFNNRIINNFHGIISAYSHRNKIYDNIIVDNKKYGIYFQYGCEYNLIENNDIEFNTNDGLWIGESDFNTISKNTIKNNGNTGINLSNGGYGNKIFENLIMNQSYGIYLDGMVYGPSHTYVYKNTISHCNKIGLFLLYAHGNKIKRNNFIKNNCHCRFSYEFFLKIVNIRQFSIFLGNYWDDHLDTKPKKIEGDMYLFTVIFLLTYLFNFKILSSLFHMRIVSWINFDWHPAKEPYDIGV